MLLYIGVSILCSLLQYLCYAALLMELCIMLLKISHYACILPIVLDVFRRFGKENISGIWLLHSRIVNA